MPPRKRRPRGTIGQLPSGSWRARVYAGTDPLTGKPRYLRETAEAYAAAKTALTRLQHQIDEDRYPKTDTTVRQAIAQWLEVAELEDTDPGTVRGSDPALHPADARRPARQQAGRRAAGAFLRPTAPLPGAVHG